MELCVSNLAMVNLVWGRRSFACRLERPASTVAYAKERDGGDRFVMTSGRRGLKMDNQMQKWPFPELKHITEKFSRDRIIAEGDFAAVYKGVTRNEEFMAVKKFKEKEYSEEQFFSEWSLKKHDNIVQPKAYCAEIVKKEVFSKDEQKLVYKNVAARVLCYELLPPERTLHHKLFVQSDQLDWPKRFEIIEGICRGIHHLHEQYKAGATIHMDIKPWNIVVDADDVPKLGRFGASMRIPTESRGPRECTVQQSMNKMKSDIYNLGILIMEIVSGNMCQGRDDETLIRFYKNKVQKTWTDDHIIAWVYGEYHLEQVKNCIELGIKCVHNDPGKMPTVEDIISSIKPKRNYERDEKRSFPQPTADDSKRGEKRPADDSDHQGGKKKPRQHSDWDPYDKAIFEGILHDSDSD